MAAYLGDPGARAALPDDAPERRVRDHCTTSTALRLWAERCWSWPADVQLRMVHVAARCALAVYVEAYGAAAHLRRGVEAVGRRITAPDDLELRRACGRLVEACSGSHRMGLDDWIVHRVVTYACQVAASQARQPHAAVRAIWMADLPPSRASQRAAKRASVGRGRLRNALRAELVPWLLGE